MNPSGVLAHITIHPVKSLAGADVEAARVLASGALENDRRFAMTDAEGRLVNGKREPRVHTAPLGAAARALAGDRAAVLAQLAAHFGFPVTFVENAERGFPDDTDSPGPTFVAAATLEEVARWFPGSTAETMRRRFRVNLVVDGFPAFGEDALVGRRFRIGAVTFEGTNPCARCSVPTREPQTGAGDPSFAKTFAERRRETFQDWAPRERFDHFYRLGLNTRRVEGEGPIRVGDSVATLG